MTALDSFRNPPPEDVEIAPLIFNAPAQPIRADLIANNAYFNNLSIIGNAAGTQNNSLTANFITPQSDPDFSGDYHLGIYGVADGTAQHAVVLDIFESVVNPGVSPTAGGQYEKLSICSSPPSGPFIITTAYSFPTPGQPRGIDIIPSDVLRLGSNGAASWQILGGGNGTLSPVSGSVDIGQSTFPVNAIWAYEFHVQSWANANAGVFRWDQANSRAILDVGSGAGFITANHMQLNTACSFFSGVGAPSAATGVNGDIYFNSTGAAGSTMYVKRSGSWVAIAGV